MFREITLGQYYPADSPIHKLDPRVKLFATLVYLITLFVFSSYSTYIVAALCLAVVVRISKVPPSFIFRGLRGIFFLLMLTVVFNLFLTPGNVLVRIWKFTITDQGVRVAISMAVRLILLITGASMMTLTTTPNDLTDGLEKGLGFLRKIHVPVHEIAMMMSIALRFIPILMEETDKIMKAQMARGADFEKGSIIRRAKNMIPILVPLFISAFRRANDLAMAMEARGYHGSEGRTKMRPLQYGTRDKIAYLIIFGYVAALFFINRYVRL